MSPSPAGLALDSSEGKSLPSLPEVIDRIGVGFAQLRAGFLGGGVYCGDGAEMLLISSVTKAVASEWSLGPMARGSMVTIVFVGILLGNLASGPVGDNFGRRHLIIIAYAGLFCASIVSSWAEGPVELALARFCVGASFGVGQPAWNALGSEITPSFWRIAMNGCSQALFVLGEIYSAFLILCDDADMKALHWRWLLRMGALPAAIFFVGSVFLLNQSPFYLVMRGRYQEAKVVLQSMAYDNFCASDISLDFAPPQIVRKASGREILRRQIEIVFGGKLLLTTVVVMYTCFVCNLVFYGSMFAFPQVLPTIASQSSAATELLVGALWELPGMALGTIIGFHLYRKQGLKLYLLLTAISLIMFTVGAMTTTKADSTHQAAWFPSVVRCAGYYGIKCFTQVGFVLAYQYSVEIYPTEARITGTAVSIGGGRLAGMLAPLVFEVLMDWTGGYATFFFLLAFLTLVNLCLIEALPFETYGTQLKDHHDDEEEALLGSEATMGVAGTFVQHSGKGGNDEPRGMGP